MADLFVDLGDYYFKNISFEHANAFYEIAQIYYKSDRKDIDKKIEQARKLHEKYANSGSLEPDENPSLFEMRDKANGVHYQNYVNNPTGSNYRIDWSKVETDPQKLLGYLGIKIESPKEEKVESQKPDSTKEVTTKNKTDRSALWIGLTIMGLVLSIFSYFKTKKKKR